MISQNIFPEPDLDHDHDHLTRVRLRFISRAGKCEYFGHFGSWLDCLNVLL